MDADGQPLDEGQPLDVAERLDGDDRQQMTEESVAAEIHAIQEQLSTLGEELPERIKAHSDAKRDLDVAKAEIGFLKTQMSGLQSVLRTLRP